MRGDLGTEHLIQGFSHSLSSSVSEKRDLFDGLSCLQGDSLCFLLELSFVKKPLHTKRNRDYYSWPWKNKIACNTPLIWKNLHRRASLGISQNLFTKSLKSMALVFFFSSAYYFDMKSCRPT